MKASDRVRLDEIHDEIRGVRETIQLLRRDLLAAEDALWELDKERWHLILTA